MQDFVILEVYRFSPWYYDHYFWSHRDCGYLLTLLLLFVLKHYATLTVFKLTHVIKTNCASVVSNGINFWRKIFQTNYNPVVDESKKTFLEGAIEKLSANESEAKSAILKLRDQLHHEENQMIKEVDALKQRHRKELDFILTSNTARRNYLKSMISSKVSDLSKSSQQKLKFISELDDCIDGW